MKIMKRPCLVCGEPMEFIYVEESDIGRVIEGIEIDGNEVGWWPADCPLCGMHYEYDYVEARMNGELFGFIVPLDDEDHIRHWLRALLKECPEARQIAREVLEEDK